MHTSEKHHLLKTWQNRIGSLLAPLRQIAGSTEHEFLHIGEQLQNIYMAFTQMSSNANKLVETASGEHIVPLIDKLNEIVREMEFYLQQTDDAAISGKEVMTAVEGLLCRIDNPLEGFKRMGKHLYMLEVSIKIESARIGEKGSEFVTLAQDIKKLAQQVKEKAGAIQDNRLLLARLLKKDVFGDAMQLSDQSEADQMLGNMRAGLRDLEEANGRFSDLGSEIATVSDENSRYISTVVQSMQFHDIFRQQVEHVIEALEGIAETAVAQVPDEGNEEYLRTGMGRIGDVCELQEAQLKFAVREFHEAVKTILDNLSDIDMRQQEMAGGLLLGIADASSGSFIDDVSRNMAAGVELLDLCAQQNDATTATLQQVTTTIRQMTGFVEVIRDIGSEIIQISLNARIKVSGTGTEGNALSVLAEEIGQLSNEAVKQTGTITDTLTEIEAATSSLTNQVNTLEHTLRGKLAHLKAESSEVVRALESLENELVTLTKNIRQLSGPLSRNIGKLCTGVDLHRRIQEKAGGAEAILAEIFTTAREHYPASDEFREDLRRMAEKYTMESERRIHEAISNRHGVQTSLNSVAKKTDPEQKSTSEFGDNVDLF